MYNLSCFFGMSFNILIFFLRYRMTGNNEERVILSNEKNGDRSMSHPFLKVYKIVWISHAS